MVPTLRKIFRGLYYTAYGASGKKITINGETYTVSAHVARGIKSNIDETPLKLLCNMCLATDVLFDIGANIGVISVILAKKMKHGSVIHAFEPAPQSYNYLKDTARVQKGNARVITVNYAVSNKNDKLYFTNDGNSCTNHVMATQEKNTIAVNAITIDEYCQLNNVIPGVIKIDVEGAEFWALEGMRQTLKNNNITVLVEIHQGYLLENGITGLSFKQYLDTINYRAFTETGVEIPAEEIINHVCVILARQKPADAIFNI